MDDVSGDRYWRCISCCCQRSAFLARSGQRATLRTLASVCSAFVLERVWAVKGTSHSARTRAHSAGQCSDQNRSNRASRKLAQLASEAFSAGRPKRSQLLRSSTFQASSEVGDEGSLCIMARMMACCACCRANLSLVSGWTYVVPRRYLVSVHEIVLNYWKSMIASS